MCRTSIIILAEDYTDPGMIPEQHELPRPPLLKRLVQLPNTLSACPAVEKKKEGIKEETEFDPATCKTPPPSEDVAASSAQEESENLRKAKSVVITRSRRYPVNGHSYTAVNVKAINRSSENLAQYINHKEDKRLARTLTSIDREKTVFSNSITRDEKILLQRSKALAQVLLARPTPPVKPAPIKAKKEGGRRVSSSPVRSYTYPDVGYLYGEDTNRFTPSRNMKRSMTAKVLRRSATVKDDILPDMTNVGDTSSSTSNARLLWANSVNSIMKRDIKSWHKAYLSSTKCSTTAPTPPPLSRTPTMPVIPADKSPASSPVITDPLDTATLSKHFSNGDIDKGAWITNYINTSCAEHFPII